MTNREVITDHQAPAPFPGILEATTGAYSLFSDNQLVQIIASHFKKGFQLPHDLETLACTKGLSTNPQEYDQK